MKSREILAGAAVAIMILGAAGIAASENAFSSNILKLWFTGQKGEVRAIADQRLQSDPNDVVGLILKLQCELDASQFSDASVTMDHVLGVAASVTTPQFSQNSPRLESAIIYLQEQVLPHGTVSASQTRKTTVYSAGEL